MTIVGKVVFEKLNGSDSLSLEMIMKRKICEYDDYLLNKSSAMMNGKIAIKDISYNMWIFSTLSI